MLCREETNGDINPQVIAIILDLFAPLIPHGVGIPFAQPFLRWMVV